MKTTIWVETRIPVQIVLGEHGMKYATSQLIKGLIVAIPEGTNVLKERILISEAVEALGFVAVEERQIMTDKRCGTCKWAVLDDQNSIKPFNFCEWPQPILPTSISFKREKISPTTGVSCKVWEPRK